MGDPRPPALRLPVRVVDLTAVEHGNKIAIRFTIPTVTTEALAIREPLNIELRVGPAGANGFNLEEWIRTSDRVTRIPQSNPVADVSVDVQKYNGKTVVVGMRALGAKGKSAGWSNMQEVTVAPPLPQPMGLEAKDGPDSVELTWQGAAGEFRVYRRTPDIPDYTLLGTATKPSYTDSTIDYGKIYQYQVQAIQKTGSNPDQYAESELSDPIPFKPYDKFPPAVPTALSAIAGTRTIELVWERSAERDFASYRVYRNGQKVADNLTAPAYSDKDVQPGITYRYEVTALDSTGNESAKSAAAEATIP
jgi:hypothetical protein